MSRPCAIAGGGAGGPVRRYSTSSQTMEDDWKTTPVGIVFLSFGLDPKFVQTLVEDDGYKRLEGLRREIMLGRKRLEAKLQSPADWDAVAEEVCDRILCDGRDPRDGSALPRPVGRGTRMEFQLVLESIDHADEKALEKMVDDARMKLAEADKARSRRKWDRHNLSAEETTPVTTTSRGKQPEKRKAEGTPTPVEAPQKKSRGAELASVDDARDQGAFRTLLLELGS